MSVRGTFLPAGPNAWASVDEVLIDGYRFNYLMPVDTDALNYSLDKGRLQVAALPYNVAPGSPTFDFSQDAGSTAQETYIMRAQDMGLAVATCLPHANSLEAAAINYPGTLRRYRSLPGNPLFLCKRASAEPFDPGKSIDPYETDPDRVAIPPPQFPQPWLDRYGHLIKLTLHYEYDPFRQRDFDFFDPRTFTEISSSIGGEFLNIGQQATRFVPVPSSGFTLIEASPDDFDQVNNPANWRFVDIVPADITQPNADFDCPLTMVIANTEYSVVWPDVWDPPWMNIKQVLGKINDAPLPWLNNAAQETVLFLGASAKQQPGTTYEGERLWTLEYKFVEKRIMLLTTYQQGLRWLILTWNHFWRPRPDPKLPADQQKGNFAFLVLNATGEPLYKTLDFMRYLFKRDRQGPGNMPKLQLRHNTERGMVPANPHPVGYSTTDQAPTLSFGARGEPGIA